MTTELKNSFIERANAASDTGDLGEAIKILTEAIENKLNDAEIYALRGYYLYLIDEYTCAIENFTSALFMKEDAPNTLFLRARCYEEIERLDDAANDYIDVIRYDPNAKDAYLNIAMIFEFQNDYNRATQYYKKLIDRFGEDDFARKKLALLS